MLGLLNGRQSKFIDYFSKLAVKDQIYESTTSNSDEKFDETRNISVMLKSKDKVD